MQKQAKQTATNGVHCTQMHWQGNQLFIMINSDTQTYRKSHDGCVNERVSTATNMWNRDEVIDEKKISILRQRT